MNENPETQSKHHLIKTKVGLVRGVDSSFNMELVRPNLGASVNRSLRYHRCRHRHPDPNIHNTANEKAFIIGPTTILLPHPAIHRDSTDINLHVNIEIS